MKHRKLTGILMTMFLTIGLVGCGGTSPNENANNTDTSTKKTVVTFTYRDDGQGDQGAMHKWLTDSMKTFPGSDRIELKIAPITASEGDYFAKIALSLQSPDTAPDIVTEDTFMLNSDATAGYLEPLDDRLSKWDDWSAGNFIEALKTGITAEDGKMYGVPYCTDTRGLWYNKEIFEKVGLPTDWQPKDWNEILDACRIIKEKAPDVVPFWMNSGKATGEATSMQTYEMLLYGTGEKLYDFKNNKWIVESQGINDSLEFIDTIYKEELGPPLSKVLNGQASNTSAREYLPQGKLAISLDGMWITGNYVEGGSSVWPEYKDVLGFAPMPTSKGQDKGSITLAGGWALSIPKNSKNKDAAWEVIQHLLNKENSLNLVLATGNITSRRDVAEDPKYLETPFIELSTSFAETADFRPAVDNYPAVSTQIQTMVESVVTGTSPKDAAAKYAEDVTRIVGTDKVTKK